MKRRNILRAAAAGRSLGVCVCTAGFVLGPLLAAVPAVQAAPPPPSWKPDRRTRRAAISGSFATRSNGGGLKAR